MSLKITAQHLANQGRGNDSSLVHMSPREISALNDLARSKGQNLTINPQTGLPEAGLLEDLLPAVVGGALNYFAPGVGTAVGGLFGLGGAAGTGIAVGALSGLASGNLGKGLMAGLGAYGGAGVTEGIAGLGMGNIGREASEAAVNSATQQGLTGEAYNKAVQESVAQRMANVPMSEKFGAGMDFFREKPMEAAKVLGKSALTAAAPIFAGQEVSESIPTTTPKQSTGYIRPYSYDRYRQEMIAEEPYEAANGGLMSIANEGAAYADGGTVGFAAGGVSDAEIKSYIDANISNPQAIADAAKQYGVSAQDLSRAGGYSLGQVNDYFTNAGINFGGQTGGGQANITNPSIYDPFGGAAAYSNPLVGGFGSAQPAAPTQPAQSAAAAYAASQGKDLSGIINEWIGSNPNATRAAIDQQMQQYGISKTDLEKALENPAYSANTRAGLLQQNKGLAELNQGITGWLAANPNATDAQVDAAMAQWGVSGMDVGRALKPYGGSKGSEHALLAGNMGLSGLNTLITNWLAANPKATYNQAVQELGISNLNEADVKRATGKTLAQLFPVPLNKATDLAGGVGGQTGPGQTGGGTVVNPNGTITTSPNIPGIPAGGFTGMEQVRNAYTAGGGKLGITPSFVPKTVAEMNARYANTGDSKAMYDYLTGKGPYPVKTGTQDPAGAIREVARPYNEAVLGMPAKANKPYIWNPVKGEYSKNPDYVRQAKIKDAEGNLVTRNFMSLNQVKSALGAAPDLAGNSLVAWAKRNNVDQQTLADALGKSVFDIQKMFLDADEVSSTPTGTTTAANGGLMALAKGGLAYAAGGGIEDVTDPATGDKYIYDYREGGRYRKAIVVKDGVTYKWNPVTKKYEASSGNAGVDTLMNNQTAGGGGQTNFEPPSQFDTPSGIGIGGRTPLAADYLSGKISGFFAGPRTDAPAPVEDRTPTAAPTPANTAAADYAGQVAAQTQAADADAMANAMSGADGSNLGNAPQGNNDGLGGGSKAFAYGGMAHYAQGGLGSLGGYSDGGQLLRGPGDGVSDNIPATIGGKQPARLANNEFVIPARIVSELGNGSTEAGAKRLYEMMDRVQNARKKSIGKGKVAVDSKAYRHLPA